MPLPIFGAGDLQILNWGTESTPGTPVAGTSHLAVTPGTANISFDPNRLPVDISAGSVNLPIALVDHKGKGTWAVKFPVFETLNQDFLTACGMGATLTAPSSLTLVQSYTSKSVAYPGARCTKVKLSDSAAQGLMADVSGVFTARPVIGSPSSAPSITGTDPYTFVNLGAITLISGATTNHDAESWELTIDFAHAMGYGNSGVPLPNILVLSSIHVAGMLNLYFNDTNFAEYADFIASGGTAGSLSIPYSLGAGTITIGVPNAKYTGGPITTPAGGLNLEKLAVNSFAPSLGNQLTWTVT